MEDLYEVIHNFKDLEDENHLYLKGVEGKNIYPREGLKPTKTRIKELTSNKNNIGKILIKKIEDESKEKNEVEESTEAEVKE